MVELQMAQLGDLVGDRLQARVPLLRRRGGRRRAPGRGRRCEPRTLRPGRPGSRPAPPGGVGAQDVRTSPADGSGARMHSARRSASPRQACWHCARMSRSRAPTVAIKPGSGSPVGSSTEASITGANTGSRTRRGWRRRGLRASRASSAPAGRAAAARRGWRGRPADAVGGFRIVVAALPGVARGERDPVGGAVDGRGAGGHLRRPLLQCAGDRGRAVGPLARERRPQAGLVAGAVKVIIESPSHASAVLSRGGVARRAT